MLRLKNLSNKYQKRTCRPLYAQTQATPYAATLYTKSDGTAGFRSAAGALQLPSGTETVTGSGTLYPGIVMARLKGSEQVTVATGGTGEQPFGLLANFVGGDLDEGFSGDSLQNSVGVWRGQDSVFEILAPAFASGVVLASDGTTGQTLLYPDTKGRLTTNTSTAGVAVARLIEVVGSSRIIVDLAI